MKILNMTLKVLIFFTFLVNSSTNVMASAMDKDINPKLVCINATAAAEQKHKIRRHLLTTIANVETGRWDSEFKRRTTWPWTVNANGKSFYYETKREAIRAVKKFKKEGIKSIDVGCMQINLGYHQDAFNTLEDAFDPYINVEYGAKFLKQLHKETSGDWNEAATFYHSKNPVKAERYKNKLAEIYKDIRPYIELDISTAKKETKLAKEVKEKKFSRKIAKAKEKQINHSANEWRMAKLEEYQNRKLNH